MIKKLWYFVKYFQKRVHIQKVSMYSVFDKRWEYGVLALNTDLAVKEKKFKNY